MLADDVDEPGTTTLMVLLQINSDYFDERFPRTDNCPFERQLAGSPRAQEVETTE